MTFSGKDGYQAKLNFSPLNDRYAGKLITMNYAYRRARSRVQQPLLSSPLLLPCARPELVPLSFEQTVSRSPFDIRIFICRLQEIKNRPRVYRFVAS